MRNLAWRNRAVRYRSDTTLLNRVKFSWPIHVGRRRYRREPVQKLLAGTQTGRPGLQALYPYSPDEAQTLSAASPILIV
jgi:hypothetical protein